MDHLGMQRATAEAIVGAATAREGRTPTSPQSPSGPFKDSEETGPNVDKRWTIFQREKARNPCTEPNEQRKVTSLRVMSWNTLAQSLATDSFPLAPPASLTASYRGERIVREVLRWEPDILCLQEVDAEGALSRNYFEQRLGRNGYFLASGAVKKNGNDGCCIFLRSHLRPLVGKSASVYLADSNQVAACVQISDGKDLDVLIGTTHLKAKSGNEELRNRQAQSLRTFLNENSLESSAKILCGDFNAEPKECAIDGMKRENWRSAYEECLGAEPYSTWKIRRGNANTSFRLNQVKRCIDYIWLQNSGPEKLVAESCALPPRDEHVGEERFPSWQFPSDHVNLVADVGVYLA